MRILTSQKRRHAQTVVLSLPSPDSAPHDWKERLTEAARAGRYPAEGAEELAKLLRAEAENRSKVS